MSYAACSQEGLSLAGVRVAVLGKLSGMTRRDAQQLIRQSGGIVQERPDATAHLLVVGDEQRAALWVLRLPIDWASTRQPAPRLTAVVCA